MSRTRTLPFLAAALTLFAAAAAAAAAAPAAELASLPEAQALAAGGHKPILIEFWMPG